MKLRSVLSAMMLMAFVLGGVSLSAQTQDKNAKSKEAEVTFVSSIDCPNCQKKVEAKLPFEKGVKDMKITLDKQEIWILYQTDKTDKAKLAAAIEKLGYTAVEKVEEEKKK